jgi:hypothetical protein
LSAADLEQIERALSGISVQGERYPKHLQQLINR